MIGAMSVVSLEKNNWLLNLYRLHIKRHKSQDDKSDYVRKNKNIDAEMTMSYLLRRK